ncbi:MAG: tripartite tricarboxylate transporter substrate binding protein [Betaproteobacteria bacterium]|nr:tripartite tricarboxylate transporter substrate binding protein [Betaproteobacteria bacterium]
MNKPVWQWMLAAAACSGLAAQAQPYPAKPIRFVVPVVAGGSNDILARLIADRLRERWGQPVVVDNRAGAGQMIGSDHVAKAAPDGYTILVPTGTYTTSAAMQTKLPFDPVNDLTGVAMIGQGPFMLAVHPSLPVKSVKELIALARARPGDISFSTAGAGSIVHFATEEFASAAQIKVLHVPYKSGVPAMTAAVGGEVQMVIISMPAVWPHVKSGRMRGLAVTTAKRSAFVPDLPALSETIPGYSAVQWWAFLAPAKTPAEIVTKLNAELNRIIGSDEMKPRLAEQGAEPMLMSADQFTKFFREEIAKWRRVVKTLNLQP